MLTSNVQEVPSFMRVVPGSINLPVSKFPSVPKPAESDPQKVASDFVNSFNQALSKSDYQAISDLFGEPSFWRDHLALSWSFRTVTDSKGVLDFLQECAASKDGPSLKSISVDDSTAVRKPQVAPVDGTGEVMGVQFFIKVETAIGSGNGLVRLVEDKGNWKVFTLYTTLQELKGHEEAIYSRRPRGVEHGDQHDRKNWAERREAEADFGEGREPVVLVIGKFGATIKSLIYLTLPGAGQAGLTAAARLKMLGVDTLMIDQNERIGDNWRNRYHQLVLHDPVWYDHLPYLPFPAQWPIFTPKDKLAEFFESYATLLELNVWMRTTLVDSKWSDEKKSWTVTVTREKESGVTETRVFHPRHIIQATGHAGKKSQPDFPGVENFKGDTICHSSEFHGAKANSEGKKAVVVGSCNSGHDIAQDFLEKGYHVTIVQRSTTHVVSSHAITEIAMKGLYSEDGPPVDDADTIIHSFATPVLKAIQVKVAKLQEEYDNDLLNGLEKAGFKLDRGPDESGLFFKYFQRGGGYYIDVGASKLIADGQIKVKQGQEIAEILPNGIRFGDNSELEADEIVFATGYQNMRTQTRLIFGDEVANKVKDVWGFNQEGELRALWQNSGHPGFWFHGGNLALCRYYSRFLALQIKAQEEGIYH